MSNTLMYDTGKYLGTDGLKWTVAKFKAILVDMNDAGPVPGSRIISSITSFANATLANNPATKVTTSAAHGLSAGEEVNFGNISGTTVSSRANSTAYSVGKYISDTSNTYKFKCIKAGTSASVAPTFPSVAGTVVIDGSVVWQEAGIRTTHTLNGVYKVAIVVDPTSFVIDQSYQMSHLISPLGSGMFARTMDMYLSQFVPLHGRVSVSDPLAYKAVLLGGILDSQDITFNLPVGNDSAESIIIVRAANRDTDYDLPDTEQVVMAYFDTLTGLPVQASSVSPLVWSVSANTERLMRL